MSKKSGALFSKVLFGYKRSDVNEYIRVTDQTRAEELAHVNSEKEVLLEKLHNAETRISELETAVNNERMAAQERIVKLTKEYEKRVSDLSDQHRAFRDKLNESETRASSYLKLVDSSSLRAESAEAELSILSAALDDSKAEIEALNIKIAQKEQEIKRISEIESLAKKMLERNIENADKQKRKAFSIRIPFLSRGKHS